MVKREIGSSSTGDVDKTGRKPTDSGGPYRSDAHAVVIALSAIRLGKFPCETYVLAGRKRVINRSVLIEFFQLDD